MTDEASIDDKARKERSPSFPFIPLEKAIARAKEVADAHRRSPARPTVVGQTWGYGPKSSGLIQTVAALKAFGLLEDIGRGEERRVQLTDLAWRILHDTREGAREQAIKEAALKPRLIAEYAQNWVPDRPSDNHCVSELHLDRGFTQASAELFLKVFDTTIAFANLRGPDNLSPVPAPADPRPIITPGSGMPSLEKMVMDSMGPLPRPQSAQAPTAASAPRATLPLPEGVVALEIPLGLSRKSYEALKAWMSVMVSLAEKDIVEKWFVETYLPTSTKAETSQVLPSWHMVKGFISAVRSANRDTIFRVIAADSASEADLAELSAMGVRTF